MFKILIEQYERDMKKMKFSNFSWTIIIFYQLKFLKRFLFFLNVKFKNYSKDLAFKIGKVNKRASLFKVKKSIDHLIIPKTAEYESTDYLITSINCVCNFSIRIVDFVEDSTVCMSIE